MLETKLHLESVPRRGCEKVVDASCVGFVVLAAALVFDVEEGIAQPDSDEVPAFGRQLPHPVGHDWEVVSRRLRSREGNEWRTGRQARKGHVGECARISSPDCGRAVEVSWILTWRARRRSAGGGRRPRASRGACRPGGDSSTCGAGRGPGWPAPGTIPGSRGPRHGDT